MKQLVRVQNGLKGSLDKAYHNYKKADDVSKSTAYLRERIKQISELWSRFQEGHFEIITSDDKIEENKALIDDYNDKKLYEEFEHTYFVFIGELNELVAQRNKNAEQGSTKEDSSLRAKVDVKLPRIDLPRFNGDYRTWRSFHDMFSSLIHKETRISDVQKLHYLKSCLSGEAERLLKQFEMVDKNYAKAWQTLMDRYNNKRILVSHQVKELLNQPMVKWESKKAIKELLDKTKESLHELNTLGVSTTGWDPILVHVIVQRLPQETLKLWEQEISRKRDLPKVEELYDFLESRFRTLEAITYSNVHATPQGAVRKTLSHHLRSKASQDQEGSYDTKQLSQGTAANKQYRSPNKTERLNRWKKRPGESCVICKNHHPLYTCTQFLNMSLTAKRQVVDKNTLCSNCLSGHRTEKCPSKKNCYKCGKRHHTTLHQEPSKDQQPGNDANDGQKKEQSFTTTKCHYNNHVTQTILATAIVNVQTSQGNTVALRALIDLGSQSSFITESACQAIKAECHPTYLQIEGLGSAKLNIAKKEAVFTLSSRVTKFELPMRAYVIKKITRITLPQYIDSSSMDHITNLQLADPTFAQPGNIDVLLGVNVYARILRNGVINQDNKSLIAQNTELGWILFGEVPTESGIRQQSSFNAVTQEQSCIETLRDQIHKFWECEENEKRKLSKEEEDCERHYEKTMSRLSTGDYQVRLPFRDGVPPKLGDSRRQAMSRFLQMERKLATRPKLREEYDKCLDDYITQGHMVPVPKSNGFDSENCGTSGYYLPHHAVIKESSTSTKVRVVFDASAKTTNGLSLNEQMLSGPTIQPKLQATLLKWRKHQFAMSADIQKMYRMIKMHPEDQKYQRIFWRPKDSTTIAEFQLTTVTFGTTSAPYLAIRTLQQLAKDEYDKYPTTSEVILKDFYVDDLLTGAETLEKALRLQSELLTVLRSGGFYLRKWTANHNQLLQQIPEEDREVQLPLEIFVDKQIKALGVCWYPSTDVFSFKIKMEEFNKPPTSKRNILSEIAKLYDPLGWLAPSIVIAKSLMQQLWISACTWDGPVPVEIRKEWQQFKDEILHLNTIKVPRWINTTANTQAQLHAFCDASSKAYAAVVYCRTRSSEGQVHSSLLTAKTKVAPIKPVTLPRLELCGAVLLARLVHQIKEDMNLEDLECFCWCDSKIVLSWLNKPAHTWQTFVANRIGEIQEKKNNCTWKYVQSRDNPADLASRGVSPNNLPSCEMWWNGPKWLLDKDEPWREDITEDFTTILERRSVKSTLLSTIIAEDIFLRCSTYEKLLGVTAYCLRFITNCKTRTQQLTKEVTIQERNKAKETLIRCTQESSFSEELRQLRRGKGLCKTSPIQRLCPFIDDKGILRIGGRLAHSPIAFDTKHPILLPKRSHFTETLIDYFHKITLHGGAQLVVTTLRMHGFWVINGMHITKGRIAKCTTCIRYQHRQQTQVMGDLPAVRVTKARPFQNIGIDYAGPITIKMSKHRGSKLYKGYICVIVCMAIKAIHLEVVSDLTTEAFIAALRRFMARRGVPTNIYSDNGTTFTGAEKYLNNITKQAEKAAEKTTTMNNVKWHFTPPYAPHMGGLWEAGVKAVKHHLKRIVQNNILSYEELVTLLTQIEACVNSRPLCTIKEDPTSLEPLTPGHFLIGTALLAPPEEEIPQHESVHNRWKYLQQLKQSFWARWRNEYILQLQQRQKWNKVNPNLKIGQIVLIREEKLPPQQWQLGRIIQTHSGKDHRVRVVTVKTQSTVIKRPITRICPLPTTE